MPKANFFLVGAAKAGTTSIARFLEGVPGTYFSPIKEPCHFCPDINDDFRAEFARQRLVDLDRYLAGERKPLHMHLVENDDQYASLFEAAGHARLVGEASTFYLLSKVAAGRIYRYNPEAKIVAVLREPRARIMSHYMMDRRTGLERRPLAACLAEEEALGDRASLANCRMYLAQSDYDTQLARYFNTFPPEQVLVLRFEELIAAPTRSLQRLLEFAGLDAEGVDLTLPRENDTDKMPRFGKLDALLYRTGTKRLLESVLPSLLPDWAKSLIKKVYIRDRRGQASDALGNIDAASGLHRLQSTYHQSDHAA